MVSTLSKCKCPPTNEKCKCDEPSVLATYALYKSIIMVLTALVGGFALAIAVLFSGPIAAWIVTLGIQEPWASVITGVIFLVIAMILVIIMILVNRSANKTKEIAKLNNYVLE